MIDERWSANRIKTWHRCPRKFHNSYILGLGEPSTPTTDFGSVGHERLEERLLNMQDPALPKPTMHFLSDPYEVARMTALLTGYEVRWAGDVEQYIVLGVEVPFEFELGGHVFQGKMDGLVQRKADGRVLILEHKFTGSDVSPGSNYFEKLALDVQCSIYIDAAAALGYGDVDVLYDVVAKPKHERKLATPEADRTMTKGRGCKVCGGKASGVQGSGKRKNAPTVGEWAQDAKGDWRVSGDGWDLLARDCGGYWLWKAEAPDASHGDHVDTEAEAKEGAINALTMCPACQGYGWEEAPRLHANQRATDETPDEFHDRVLAEIAARPDDFFSRTLVTRTEAQKVRGRASILDTIKLARLAEVVDAFPMNDSACFAYNTRCPYLSACQGVDDINDRNRFPLRSKP